MKKTIAYKLCTSFGQGSKMYIEKYRFNINTECEPLTDTMVFYKKKKNNGFIHSNIILADFCSGCFANRKIRKRFCRAAFPSPPCRRLPTAAARSDRRRLATPKLGRRLARGPVPRPVSSGAGDFPIRPLFGALENVGAAIGARST